MRRRDFIKANCWCANLPKNRRWGPCRKIAKVGENHMSELLECRERLESAHTQMQEAMTELITNKNYSEAERLLHAVDKLMPI